MHSPNDELVPLSYIYKNYLLKIENSYFPGFPFSFSFLIRPIVGVEQNVMDDID